MTVSSAKKIQRRQRAAEAGLKLESCAVGEVEVTKSKQGDSSPGILWFVFSTHALSWFYLLHFAPNHYEQPLKRTLSLSENFFGGSLLSIFGPVLLAIEGAWLVSLLIFANSALTLTLITAKRYKSSLASWLLTGSFSFFSMFICSTDSSTRELSNMGAFIYMVIAPLVTPIILILFIIGITIAGINSALKMLESFVARIRD